MVQGGNERKYHRLLGPFLILSKSRVSHVQQRKLINGLFLKSDEKGKPISIYG